MYIREIKGIPMFIGRYFNLGKISIEDIKEFNKILLNSEYYLYNKNKYAVKLKYKPAFVDFYIKYSKVDRYGNCRYEDELDLPKSVYYETFNLIVVGGEIKSISLDFDEEESILILNVEDDLVQIGI